MYAFFQISLPILCQIIDHTWVTSIWKFANQAHLTVEVEHHWTPPLTRQHDAALMDVAMQLNFSSSQLAMLNTCRLHLQVITIRDVTNACGSTITRFIFKGDVDNQRSSNLSWPKVPCPPQHFWPLWEAFLHTLCHGTRLQTPLGNWLTRPHKQWHWYADDDNTVFYQSPDTGSWSRYLAQWQSGWRTRRGTFLYRAWARSDPPDVDLTPVSLTDRKVGSFTIERSPNSFPNILMIQPRNL
jgi:hypothetical protein